MRALWNRATPKNTLRLIRNSSVVGGGYPRWSLGWHNDSSTTCCRRMNNNSPFVHFTTQTFHPKSGDRKHCRLQDHVRCLCSSLPWNEGPGEEAYQQYLQCRSQLDALVQEKERLKSQAMFEAWQQATSTTSTTRNNSNVVSVSGSKNTKVGVTVVRTLARHTQREHEERARSEQELQLWKQRAQDFLQKAAIFYGHPLALVALADQELVQAKTLLEEMGEEREDRNHEFDLVRTVVGRALSYYRRAGENGYAKGWLRLGVALWDGIPSNDEDYRHHGDEVSDCVEQEEMSILRPDRVAAMEAFQKAVGLGDLDARYFVGVTLLSHVPEGAPTLPDTVSLEELRAGLQYIQEAANQGHGGAMYYLALFHLNGHQLLGVPPCSAAQYVELLNRAVDAGDVDALFARGHCYYYGENGYPIDMKKALEDFTRAAEAGHADAAVSAGAILHTKHPGVEQDPARAFQLYQYAGELGSEEGWRNVVACYATGQGVPQSLDMANYIARTMLSSNKEPV